jgi:hypothetical protein
MAKWADEHSRFVYPDGAHQLALDEDLVALNIAFDQSEFFDRVLADPRSMDKAVKARAIRLVKPYLPIPRATLPTSGTSGGRKTSRSPSHLMRATIGGASTRRRRDGAFLYWRCQDHGARTAPDGKPDSKSLG